MKQKVLAYIVHLPKPSWDSKGSGELELTPTQPLEHDTKASVKRLVFLLVPKDFYLKYISKPKKRQRRLKITLPNNNRLRFLFAHILFNLTDKMLYYHLTLNNL